jgi:hypothetical protein
MEAITFVGLMALVYSAAVIIAENQKKQNRAKRTYCGKTQL